MNHKELDKTFKGYMAKFTSDKELGQMMSRITFQELFNPKFLQENSKFPNNQIWRCLVDLDIRFPSANQYSFQ